jgi:uncharacterized protein (DUF849 family)
MKEQKDLELLRADRREFTVAAMLAMLGGVSITISGCGKAASSPSSPSVPSTPAPVADKAGTIANNHGHVAVITGAQLTAASTLALSLQGTASHNHMLELSGAELAQIRDGRTFAKECTGTSHTHMVTFN